MIIHLQGDNTMTKTRIMGVLNVTPDSYHEPSRATTVETAIEKVMQMIQDGASIIDIGGESTRPPIAVANYEKAAPVSEAEELQRVISIIKALKGKVPLSIDTIKPKVAAAALEAGASFINDISGFTHPDMRRVAAESGVEICVMHMQGTPATMQIDPTYPEGVIPHLVEWFKRQVDLLVSEGVSERKIYLDPGIGFGKTVAHNLEIIHNLQKLKAIGFPLLLGSSRKSFMSHILSKPTAELLPATLAVSTFAVLAGVEILRVHDVKEHHDMITLMECVRSCKHV